MRRRAASLFVGAVLLVRAGDVLLAQRVRAPADTARLPAVAAPAPTLRSAPTPTPTPPPVASAPPPTQEAERRYVELLEKANAQIVNVQTGWSQIVGALSAVLAVIGIGATIGVVYLERRNLRAHAAVQTLATDYTKRLQDLAALYETQIGAVRSEVTARLDEAKANLAAIREDTTEADATRAKLQAEVSSLERRQTDLREGAGARAVAMMPWADWMHNIARLGLRPPEGDTAAQRAERAERVAADAALRAAAAWSHDNPITNAAESLKRMSGTLVAATKAEQERRDAAAAAPAATPDAQSAERVPD